MEAPTSKHQLAAGEIYRQIANFIIENDGKCQVYIAPTDVQIKKDNRTMVDPEKRRLQIYRFDQGETPIICGLDKPQPIGIYDGRLEIDFTYVNRLLDKIKES